MKVMQKTDGSVSMILLRLKIKEDSVDNYLPDREEAKVKSVEKVANQS